MRFAASHQDRSTGQSLVEFTIALPVFLLVMLAIAEGGYFVAATTAVSHATHEGARLGVLDSTGASSAIRSRVKESASVLVTVTDSDISLELNGTACNDACYSGRNSGDRLGVTTAYTHRPLISFVFDSVGFQANATTELFVE